MLPLSSAGQLLTIRRGLNTTAKANVANIFDREAKRKQRNRAGIARDAADYDLLKDKAGSCMITCIVTKLCFRWLKIFAIACWILQGTSITLYVWSRDVSLGHFL